MRLGVGVKWFGAGERIIRSLGMTFPVIESPFLPATRFDIAHSDHRPLVYCLDVHLYVNLLFA